MLTKKRLMNYGLFLLVLFSLTTIGGCISVFTFTQGQCGEMIARSVTLTQDIKDCLGDALQIVASHVTLDCNGHTISGRGRGKGIEIYKNRNGITIKNCVIRNFNYGIYIESSSNNILINNTVSNNDFGIHLTSSSKNTLTDNKMSESKYNFGIYGERLSDFIHNIDASNKVEEKPIYYWVNKQNQQVSKDAGYVGIVNSTNITIKDLTLTNNIQGLLLAYSTNSMIENVNTFDNNFGIYLVSSSNNILMKDTVAKNDHGLFLYNSSNNILKNNTINLNVLGAITLYNSSNNQIYHNNFINNQPELEHPTQVYVVSGSGNVFNLGPETGGNYWSDHICTGNPSDGSQPYSLSGGVDNYPFQGPNGWITPP